MTDSSSKSQSPTRYTLRTFGTLALAACDDDAVIDGHGHQRYRLALLAVLAAAGKQGRSRDQLHLLFWPDATQSRARHSLEQLLYAIRGSIDEAVFSGVNPVRLNTAVIRSDVVEFNDALMRGDLQKAVDTYRGQFLDGFYLGDAPEFDQWLDTERARLQRSYSGALERLAQSAAAAGDLDGSVRWWRKLTEIDAVSSAYAAGLMRALMDAGDHASALRHAERYETTVERDLGASAGPAVANLVAEARSKTKNQRMTPAREPVTTNGVEAPATPDGAREPIGPPAKLQSSRSRTSRPWTAIAFAGVMMMAIAATVGWVQASRSHRAVGVSSARRATVRSLASHELYLRGNEQSLFRTDSGARVALDYFQQAAALDPSSAAAYAGIARAEKRIAFGDDREMSRHDRLALAETAALKAVSIDDSSAEAHQALSFIRRQNYEMASAELELKRAASLEPDNARIHELLVQLYVLTDRAPEALIEGRRAVELDSLAATANAELAHALLANHRCGEALAVLGKIESLRPPLNRASTIAAECYASRQMWPQAVKEMQRISQSGGPRGQAILGYMLARAGREDEARRILSAALDRSRRLRGDAFDVALVYLGLNERDQAFAWLDKAVDDRSVGFEWLPMVVDDLRPDPRFAGIRRRLGLQTHMN